MTANPRVFLLFTTCDRKDFEKFTLLRKFPFFEKFPLMRQLIIFASTFASIQSRPPWTALEHCKKVTVKALYAKDVCQVLRAYGRLSSVHRLGGAAAVCELSHCTSIPTMVWERFQSQSLLVEFGKPLRCETNIRTIESRISVQGVISLGGHFACLCRGFE